MVVISLFSIRLTKPSFLCCCILNSAVAFGKLRVLTSQQGRPCFVGFPFAHKVSWRWKATQLILEFARRRARLSRKQISAFEPSYLNVKWDKNVGEYFKLHLLIAGYTFVPFKLKEQQKHQEGIPSRSNKSFYLGLNFRWSRRFLFADAIISLQRTFTLSLKFEFKSYGTRHRGI